MKEKLEAISKMSKEKIAEIKDSQALNDFKVKVLGKKGELTEILRGMKDIAAEERPVVGNLVNKIRDEIEQMIDEKESEFKNKDLQERLEKEKAKVLVEKEKTDKMLSNPGFVAKAPAAKVEEEKEKQAKFNEMIKTIEERIQGLK